MPVITYDDFSGGLDVRTDAAVSEVNILRVLQNAYVTTGRKKKIKKRPCLNHIATLEAGTVGLKTFGGVLNTFYGDAATITHSNPLFVARRVPHPTTGAAPTKIHFCEQFNALMYVVAEYAGPVYRHHYLDGGTTGSPIWVTATAYAVGVFRTPTVQNGFRYEVTAILGTGTSGGVEPTWPTTIGGTVVDNAGANQITWTARSFSITDVNCPHSKQAAKQAEKMFAVGVNRTTVPFSATGNPRDWTTASDAGFLPAGLYSAGSDEVTALHLFQKKGLAVFFGDNTQVWGVDPDPDLHDLTSNIEGIGTLFSNAAHPVSQDLFFHAQNGFRSLSQIALTDNLQENDVGSAIDDLVVDSTSDTDDPLGVYYQRLGQYWEFNGNTAWVYSFSRASKLSAWSKFTFEITVDDATVLNQQLYVRSGDDVYRVDPDVYKDGASDIPLVDVQMFYQDAKRPGVLKMFMGLDTIGQGTSTISFKFFDEDGAEHETQGYEYPAMTESGPLHPVELCATRVAPHIQHQKDEVYETSILMLVYEDLAVR